MLRGLAVGHSIAGDQTTRIAAEHPERVRALVCLDAYSYGPGVDLRVGNAPPLPPQTVPPPPITAADSASPAAMTAYWSRRFGLPALEAEVRAVSRFGPPGTLELFQAPHASEQVYAGAARSDYWSVRAPALGVYVTRTRVCDVFREFAFVRAAPYATTAPHTVKVSATEPGGLTSAANATRVP